MTYFVGVSFITGMSIGIEFFSHIEGELVTTIDIFIGRITIGLKWK